MHSAHQYFPNKIHRYIDSDADLAAYLSDLENRGVPAVALDMEGDQGTMRYAYSISIFQCFDGLESVIIDVLKMGNNLSLARFLTDPAIIKVMFSCANDIFMAQNVLGCTISPVRDIAVAQKLLNLPINLSDHLNIDKKLKDSFQRANWLKRPIHPELLDYAINDVLDLFAIENELVTQLHSTNQFDAYLKGSAQLSEKNYVIDQMQHYKVKFPGFKRLRGIQRLNAANVWVFRELLGKHFDCPVGYLLSKQALAASIRDPEHIVALLERELNRGRSAAKRVSTTLVESIYREAVKFTNKSQHPETR